MNQEKPKEFLPSFFLLPLKKGGQANGPISIG